MDIGMELEVSMWYPIGTIDIELFLFEFTTKCLRKKY